MLVLRPVFLTVNGENAKVNAACVELRITAEGDVCGCQSSQDNADYNGPFFYCKAWNMLNPMDKIFSMAFSVFLSSFENLKWVLGKRETLWSAWNSAVALA